MASTQTDAFCAILKPIHPYLFREATTLADQKKNKLFGAAASVSLVVLLSKALGFLRDIIMANMHGTSAEMDAYNAAYGIFYIPILLMSSCITSTLVPLYIQAREEKGKREANRFASNAVSIFSLVSIAVAALMALFAPSIVRLVHRGFPPQTLELTVRLARIMLPSLVFFVLAILFSTILNANRRFIPAQLTGFPLSFALITSTLLSRGPGGIRMLAWGVAAAGLLQAAVVYPFTRRDFRYYPRLDARDRRFRRMVAMAVPALLSMAVNELNHMIDRSLASGLPEGSISAMNYAFKLITFALGVLIVPLTTILFSRMSEKAAQKDKEGMMDLLSSCMGTVLLVIVPITILGCVLSRDVIALAYGRGHFDRHSVELTAGVFLFYLLGLAGFSLRDVFNRAFHSLGDTRTPMYIAGGSVALNVALNLILVRVMGANGLALATSISGLCAAGTLLCLIRRRVGRMHFSRTFKELLRIFASGGVCLALCLVLDRAVPPAEGTLRLFLRLALIAISCLSAYFLTALLLGSGSLSSLRRRLLKRR